MQDGERVDPDAPAAELVADRVSEQCAEESEHARRQSHLRRVQLVRVTVGVGWRRRGGEERESEQPVLPHALLKHSPVEWKRNVL